MVDTTVYKKKYCQTLRRQDSTEWQLKLRSWNCTISRFNFTEIKILFRPPQPDSPIGCMTNMLDHVTWSCDQTRYKQPVLSHNFQLLAVTVLPHQDAWQTGATKTLAILPSSPQSRTSSLSLELPNQNFSSFQRGELSRYRERSNLRKDDIS